MEYFHILFIYILFILSINTQTVAPAPASPNIILILMDDGGYGDINHRLPHIDSIRKNGVSFTNAYSAAPQVSS